MSFVNRDRELNALEEWWARPAASMGIVWGRRRVGKTALLERFARTRRSVFHVATGRPPEQELLELSRAAAPVLGTLERDLAADPFRNWDDAFEWLGRAAAANPLLLVLDEFPLLVVGTHWLPGYLRAMWEQLKRTRLKILISGSAVRTMWAMQTYREPLYGRFDLGLLIHPLWPHESAGMLTNLAPADRARVWGIVGGTPLYLSWWDQGRSVTENLELLAFQPGSQLLNEGAAVMDTEVDAGDRGKEVVYAIARGRTKHSEIRDVIDGDPTPALERLEELRLVERVVPVTEDPRRPRTWTYRVADNFLAFWLGVLDRYRAEIDRGVAHEIASAWMDDLDDFLGARWEEAFRMHLRRMMSDGALGEKVVGVGPFWAWKGEDPAQIDAVVLAGLGRRRAVLVGEAKWTRRVDAARIRRQLERKVAALPSAAPDLRYAVCAREVVDNADSVLAITAADIFDLP
jgi:AAA+ ATPase superfamily predicted ATPase